VLFSGVTVIAAMCTLFLVPLGVVASMALGAVVVAAFSVLTSVLLLPVLLQLLGRRIDRWVVVVGKGTHRRPAAARWAAFAGRVMRRPIVFLAVSVGSLLLLAAPSLGLSTFTPDARIIPTDDPIRIGYMLMQDQFGVGSSAPLQVLVSSPEPLGSDDGAAVADLRQRLQELPSVLRVDSALDALAVVAPDDPLSALAVGGRHVRHAGAGVPARPRRRPAGLRADRLHPELRPGAAADPAVQPQQRLRGLPPQPGPGGAPPDR
jgi:RND superfamily putative drug exporter